VSEAEAAARAFGGCIVRLIAARENQVYEMAGEAGRAVLRLHRAGYQWEASIRSELWWCAALSGAGLPVPVPLSMPDGGTVLRLGPRRFASAVSWVEGAPLGAAGVPLPGGAAEQAARHHALGSLLARVHAASDGLTLPVWFARPRWDLAGLLGEEPNWGRFWEHPALSAAEAATAARARDALLGILPSGGPIGLIHADVLRENVFVNGRSLTLIDFDDSGFGHRPYDLGTVLFQNLDEPALPAIAAALAEGYGTFRPLDAGLLPAFTLMRCCASLGWAMLRLPPGDPVHAQRIALMLRLARSVLDGRAPW
jgi:Ser/Thr protein kinase RdoA (MazF antagonist)